MLTFIVSTLLILKGGFFSEPFLLAVFGTALIFTGDLIRQRVRRNRSKEEPKSESHRQVILTSPALSAQLSQKEPTSTPSRTLRLTDDSDSPEESQLWLPLSAKRDAAEGSAEVLHQ
jgi:hypothetical protein